MDDGEGRQAPTGTGRLDDPAQMRALAHPTRLRILGLLRANGPQTAALLGAEIDEAPGTISYHCTRLAGAGLIEEAPAQSSDRRERWWRARHASSSWDIADALDDPERYLAAAALDRTVARNYAATYERYLEQAPSLGHDWVAAGWSGDGILRLNVGELRELTAELQDVLERWRARGSAHGPGDGAEQVFLLAQAYRWPR
jgi:DNA-binding transcriptional ArsR family regulator